MHCCRPAHKIRVGVMHAAHLHQAMLDALRVEHRFPISDFESCFFHFNRRSTDVLLFILYLKELF